MEWLQWVIDNEWLDGFMEDTSQWSIHYGMSGTGNIALKEFVYNYWKLHKWPHKEAIANITMKFIYNNVITIIIIYNLIIAREYNVIILLHYVYH